MHQSHIPQFNSLMAQWPIMHHFVTEMCTYLMHCGVFDGLWDWSIFIASSFIDPSNIVLTHWSMKHEGRHFVDDTLNCIFRSKLHFHQNTSPQCVLRGLVECKSASILTIAYRWNHSNDIIMGTVASQITRLTIVYSTVYSDADQRKHQSSASLAFVRGIHRRPVNSPHKGPVTLKMFPFHCVIVGQRNKACTNDDLVQ